MQKIKEPEILEPLIPSVRSCLVWFIPFPCPSLSFIYRFSKQEHRHSYVRKNAVFAILTIYRDFETLLPDAPELIQTFLIAESDMTCKRNAFVFLLNCATNKAVEYTMQVYDQIAGFDELMQLAIIELIRKDCKGESVNRVGFHLFL